MVNGGPKRKVSSLEASFSILMDAREEKVTPSVSWLGFLSGAGLVRGWEGETVLAGDRSLHQGKALS